LVVVGSPLRPLIDLALIQGTLVTVRTVNSAWAENAPLAGSLRLVEDESAPPGDLLRRLTCADAAIFSNRTRPCMEEIPQQWGKELSPTASERTRLRVRLCYSHPRISAKLLAGVLRNMVESESLRRSNRNPNTKSSTVSQRHITWRFRTPSPDFHCDPTTWLLRTFDIMQSAGRRPSTFAYMREICPMWKTFQRGRRSSVEDVPAQARS
jgi:hypothetical protein